jgi:hypothetical protein
MLEIGTLWIASKSAQNETKHFQNEDVPMLCIPELERTNDLHPVYKTQDIEIYNILIIFNSEIPITIFHTIKINI